MFWNRKYNIEELKRFYRNELINTESLYLSDIWNMTDRELEIRHDYIQWMFPTNEKSDYNRRAPVLKAFDIEVLSADTVIMNNFIKSIRVFLNFLGFELLKDNTVRLSAQFESRKSNWLKPRNHNFKRITRLLTFLRLFELYDIANSFISVLDKLYLHNKEIIGENTYAHWKRAAHCI